MANSKKKRLKIFTFIFGLLILIAVIIGYYIRNTAFKPIELEETVYIYIEPSTKYDEVVDQIKKQVNLPSEKFFKIISEKMKYPETIKTGRYAIRDGMTMPEIIRMLRSGNQSAVKLTFNNMRTNENLAGRISNQLMLDSVELLNVLKDETKLEVWDSTQIRLLLCLYLILMRYTGTQVLII